MDYRRLENAVDWERILSVLLWFRRHPRSGLYLRQLDIVGVDTKFIENRETLLSELLDIVLPADAVESTALGQRNFRHALRTCSKASTNPLPDLE